jgi:hypothetical protein
MAKSSLIVVVALALFISPRQAVPAMAVIDSAVLSKASTQITKLTEQIEKLNELRDQAQAQIDAIGRMGKITLPTINVQTLGNRLAKDAQCLKLDLEALIPNVNFEDVEINSICSSSNIYKQTLLVDPIDLKKLPWADQHIVLKNIQKRRENVLADAATKAMATGDMGLESSTELNEAANELQSSVNGAQTENARLAVIAQGQVAIIRGMAQQNQTLSQMLKLQAAFYMKAGLPVTSILNASSDDNAIGAANGDN